jgi:hypothetical protein
VQNSRTFIVAAVPRSGSTFLVKRLAEISQAWVPDVNHYELFNPYEKLFNCAVLHLDSASEVGMLDEFFRRSNQLYAGFKTIPGFHAEWPVISARSDIQFITLTRRDFLSCLASYVVSDRCFRWEQPSREQLNGQPLVFRELYATEERLTSSLGATLAYLLFNYRALETLDTHPQTISLATEDLLENNATSDRLSEFFGNPVRFDGFQAPTHYSECFADYFYYRVTVVRLLRSFLQFDSRIPHSIQALLDGS